MALILGPDGYRYGALERIEESRRLLEAGFFAGSAYLAGRAIEGMLRALCGLVEPQLDTGHDLKQLASRVRDLGLVTPGEAGSRFVAAVQGVARLWHNNLRFADSAQLERRWRALGVFGRGRARSLKEASRDYYQSCQTIFKRCEALWQRSPKAKSPKS